MLGRLRNRRSVVPRLRKGVGGLSNGLVFAAVPYEVTFYEVFTKQFASIQSNSYPPNAPWKNVNGGTANAQGMVPCIGCYDSGSYAGQFGLQFPIGSTAFDQMFNGIARH
jgi:hypothetical protein